MKRFIFGFHLCFWCPKWAPLSRRSLMVTLIAGCSCAVAKPCPFCCDRHGISPEGKITVLVFLVLCFSQAFLRKIAPDQNRTDTSSLEGYGSTIELQARRIGKMYRSSAFF